MRIDIIQIGNSKGLRLPRSIIKQCGITDAVDIEIINQTLTLTPCKESREGWQTSFQMMHDNKDDYLLDEDQEALENDHDEWQW